MDHAKWFLRIAPWVVILPFLINTAGWMLTENGRQPWIVQGLMKTANGVSPSVSATDIWISLVVFVAIFVGARCRRHWLMLRYGRREPRPRPARQVDVARRRRRIHRRPTHESSDEDESALVY